MKSPSLEVADVVRAYGSEYRKQHKLPRRHLRALRDIASYRTASLGGHVDRCDACGHERISYNSCRNRHCPKCGSLAKEKWLRAREGELLPVPYFHIVFTIPAELNALALVNQDAVYTMLFRTAAETLLCVARDPKHLGAEIGLIAVLHTWGQNLMDHPHLHCIVPGGGISKDGTQWIGSRKKFFLPVHVLSQVFRVRHPLGGLESLKKAYRDGRLKCVGRVKVFERHEEFQKLLDRLYMKGWVVYSKTPFGGPEQVLAYLGRYTHRVALTNHRLVSMTNGMVSFRWRDYRDGGKEKVMTVEACEFIRRFLLHVLPDGLCKIRSYGFLSNRKRKSQLERCRLLLGVPASGDMEDVLPASWQEILLKLTGIDLGICPSCHKGRMQHRRLLQPVQHAPP